MCDKEIVVLVDYQPTFGATHNEVVTDRVLEELHAARQRNVPIVVVEFHTYGETDQRILDALAGYDKVVRTTKYRPDGADELVADCRDRGYLPASFGRHGYQGEQFLFRIFGVESNMCVYHTARHLGTMPGAHVLVVSSACNQVGKPSWWMFESLKDVAVS